jgi:DnaJ-class molecular chaperone
MDGGGRVPNRVHEVQNITRIPNRGDDHMRLKKDEQICLQCDGAGTAPNRGVDWELVVCPGCNGHGVVAFVKRENRVVKFDVEARTATKIAKIGE